MKGNAELFLADATLYLDFFGDHRDLWMWLLQAVKGGAGPSGNVFTDHGSSHWEIYGMQHLWRRVTEDRRFVQAPDDGDGLTVAKPNPKSANTVTEPINTAIKKEK